MPTFDALKDGFGEFYEVEPNTGCWLWLKGARRGYGKINYCRRQWVAHRLMYSLFIGPIPEGHVIMHKCDTPQCVNPSHLMCGTQGDNVRDAAAKGRAHSHRTLSPMTVSCIKKWLKSGVAKKEIARRVGAWPSTIRKISKGQIYKEIQGDNG